MQYRAAGFRSLILSRKNWVIGFVLLIACNALGGILSDSGERVIWKVALKGETAPAFDDSLVFFGAKDHLIVAVEKNSGTIRWQSKTDGPLAQISGFNVIVAGNTVVVPDDLLYGLDRKSGARKWVFKPESGFLPGLFLLETDGNRVYAGSPSGYAYAVDGETGKQIWASNVTGQEKSSVYHPVYDNGVVAVSIRRFTTNPVSGGVALLDASTGNIIWQRDFLPERAGQPSGSEAKPVFFQNLVIASSDDGRIFGLNRTTGEIVWIAPSRSDLSSLGDIRPIVLSGSTVVVGSTARFLTGLDARTGLRKWDTSIGQSSLTNWLSADNGTAYTTDLGLVLVSVDAESGRLNWSEPSNNDKSVLYILYPAIDKDRLYASATTGLYALKK